MDKAARMLVKVVRLYEQAQSRAVNIWAVQESAFWETIDKHTDEKQAKHLQL